MRPELVPEHRKARCEKVSYAFVFEGVTGLTVTIGAVLTLFVLMQLTTKVKWADVFAQRTERSLGLGQRELRGALWREGFHSEIREIREKFTGRPGRSGSNKTARGPREPTILRDLPELPVIMPF